MTIQACIFDLDGVICDTAHYHYLAWKQLADELGFEFTKEDNERLKGVSRMDSLDILLEIGQLTVDEETKLVFADRKNQVYVDFIRQIGPEEILDGIKPFLVALRARGIKIALGSVSKNAEMILNNLQLKSYFDVIIDGTKITNAKPDPEVFLRGAQELSVTPDACVVFEDAYSGIEAAIRAGMKCVGVGDPDILGRADKIISGFQDVKLSLLSEIEDVGRET
ncbi:Beta-phosphoglucomutase [compost metagenome]